MGEINTLFRKRIGFPLEENISFNRLEAVLEKTAKTIPFENMCIITKNAR